MNDYNSMPQAAHRLELIGRDRLTVSGVADVERFDETGIIMSTSAGTLVITGTYRGDPLYQTVKIEGRFTRTAVNGDGTEAEDAVEPRFLDGRALLFAEVPEDGAVSDISDGLFLFIPNVQREAELQGEPSDCGG